MPFVIFYILYIFLKFIVPYFIAVLVILYAFVIFMYFVVVFLVPNPERISS